MRIQIAKTAGFCMGVRRAVDMALDLNRQKPPLPTVTYGPLIHNPQTIDLLNSRGISQVDSIDQVHGGTVIIRAHGISPQERLALEAKGVYIVDATCPRVKRVQALIQKHSIKGDYCVIVGDEDHPEVRGLSGFAQSGGISISSLEEISKLDQIPADRKLCVVAQTTQEPEKFEKIVQHLRDQGLILHVYNTICDSTIKRQSEVKSLSQGVDMIIVVGGKRSGNTIRLAQVALEQGVRVRHVETADQVLTTDLDGIRAIGITAGASTPNWQIRTLVEKLRQIDLKTRSGIWPKLRLFADYTIMTYMWAALGGAGLTLACSALQENKVDFTAAIVTALFVFSMHLINRIQESSGALRFNTPEIAEFYSRHQKMLRAIGGFAALMSVLISYFLGWVSMIMVMSMIITGILYPLPILVSLPIFGGRWSSLKDIPGSKTPLVSIGWAMSAAIIPSFSGELWAGISSIVISFIFAAGMVFWRTALSDLIDIQGDRIGGRETIPILFGGRATERILNITLLFLSCLLILSSLEAWTSKFGYLLLMNVMIFKFFFDYYKKGHLVDRLLFEGLVDGNFVLAGVVSIIYASAL